MTGNNVSGGEVLGDGEVLTATTDLSTHVSPDQMTDALLSTV
jgi:hypothetical protein